MAQVKIAALPLNMGAGVVQDVVSRVGSKADETEVRYAVFAELEQLRQEDALLNAQRELLEWLVASGESVADIARKTGVADKTLHARLRRQESVKRPKPIGISVADAAKKLGIYRDRIDDLILSVLDAGESREWFVIAETPWRPTRKQERRIIPEHLADLRVELSLD